MPSLAGSIVHGDQTIPALLERTRGAARRESRRDRSAAAATVAATKAKTTRASTLSGSLMVNSPMGGMNQ
ncbi:hypothetical protein GCM10017750_06080 [Streptomyces racemochromogenes]